MSFYMSALGLTVARDGWRFEPVPEQESRLRCRGEVRPDSRLLTCEVFVSEVIAGPIPTLYADLLGTVDGVKAFHAKRVGLRLVPDWPLAHWAQLGPAIQHTGPAPAAAAAALAPLGGLRGYRESKPVATVDGFAFDYASLLACAWGQPSKAFGPFYAPFDGVRSVARLPGPPYHFMSRVTKVDGAQGGMQQGSRVEAEYDVPASVWYFGQNGQANMPLAVLMEVALQPCGWLASYVGSTLTTDNDLLFRNLDGSATIMGEITPATGTIVTRVELQNISRNGDMIIQTFALECEAAGRTLFNASTVFGFFPKEAFVNQVGMPPPEDEAPVQHEASDFQVDLRSAPARYSAGPLKLPQDMLLMLDRVTGYWPQGGKAGLGRLRAEKTIRADDWFFKAHFFQDPVQPGSLGIEAMVQLLQFHLIESGCCAAVADPRFTLLESEKLAWKYRGQVVPSNGRVLVDMEITRCEIGPDGGTALADAWLWVDDKRIYQCRNLGLRVVSGAAH
jgi:3-hydroxymyristoyl/3-hydroxydecanoyl-(acyl carrier protein) dehydratase